MSVADRRAYLLIEMPHRLFIEYRQTAERFQKAGIRPILAHPERHPELLHGGMVIDELIRAGCLVQVSSGSVTDPQHLSPRPYGPHGPEAERPHSIP